MREALKLALRRPKRRVALVVLVAAVAAVAARVAAPAPAIAPAHSLQLSRSFCGVQRWAVKTMTDPAANRVNLRTSRSTIDTLIRQRAPLHLTQLRRGGIERTTFQVKARLVSAKIESDGDVHLVIASPTTGRTMIVPLAYAAAARPSASASAALWVGRSAGTSPDGSTLLLQPSKRLD